VATWLESEGLVSLCRLAREQGFNGGVLLALHVEIKKQPNSFTSDCKELGIPAGVVQFTLKGKLVALFG